MEQIEILRLAQEALLHRYDAARNMVAKKPSEITKAYRDQIIDQTMEINRMINAEHRRKLEEAERRQQEQQAQQKHQAQQDEPNYEIEIDFVSGTLRKAQYYTKERALKTYNRMKDIMGSPAGTVINRISLTENGMTIRSYERGDF